MNLLKVSEDTFPGTQIHKYHDGKWQEVPLSIPQEMPLDIYVNEQEFVSIHCTPLKLNFLVAGFLFGENLIQTIDDISIMRVCEESTLVDVRLRQNDLDLPQKKIVTSGCVGSASFSTIALDSRIESSTSISPERLLSFMQGMLKNAELYHQTGGIHASALCDSSGIIVMAEDIGRHNTIDKIVGECLFRRIDLRDKILLSTGRISSEIVRKAVKMAIPIIASLSSPTEKAVSIAQEANLTLVGYARGKRMTVYSKNDRLS